MNLLKICLSAALLVSFSFQQTHSMDPLSFVAITCCMVPAAIVQECAKCTAKECCQYALVTGAVIAAPIVYSAILHKCDKINSTKNRSYQKAPLPQKMN